MVEKWNSVVEQFWWNSRTVMVEQCRWNSGTVLVKQCGVTVEQCGGTVQQWNSENGTMDE